jgi:hypothetical protein
MSKNDLSRRSAMISLGAGALTLAAPFPAASSPMHLSVTARKAGTKGKITVKVSVHASPAANFSNRTLGTFYVPRDGKQFVKTVGVLGIIVKIVIVIVGVVVTVTTFGLGAGGVVLAQKTVKKTLT